MDIPRIPDISEVVRQSAETKWQMAEASGEMLRPILEAQNEILSQILAKLSSIEDKMKAD